MSSSSGSTMRSPFASNPRVMELLMLASKYCNFLIRKKQVDLIYYHYQDKKIINNQLPHSLNVQLEAAELLPNTMSFQCC
jgi:hypothetical protein